MSSINLNKLGLPSYPRNKEIIEEDYPSVSLTNRMRLIQKQFAERQADQAKDLSKPPENVKDVFYNFESTFNRLMGILKKFAPKEIKKIDVRSMNEALMAYSQLSSVYNTYVVPQLQPNEIFRREIYGKLDQLASLCGVLVNDLNSGSKEITESYLNYTLPGAWREQEAFDITRLDEYADIKFNYSNILEQIRRDALTRNLRPISFPDEQPMPGQVRRHIPVDMEEPPGQPVGQPVGMEQVQPQPRMIRREGQEPVEIDIEPEEEFIFDVVGVEEPEDRPMDTITTGPNRPPIDADGTTRDEEQQLLERLQQDDRYDAQELEDYQREISDEKEIDRYMRDPAFIQRVGQLYPDKDLSRNQRLQIVNKSLNSFIARFESQIPVIIRKFSEIDRELLSQSQPFFIRRDIIKLERDLNILQQKLGAISGKLEENGEEFLRQLSHSQPNQEERFVRIKQFLIDAIQRIQEFKQRGEVVSSREFEQLRQEIPDEAQRYAMSEEMELDDARRQARQKLEDDIRQFRRQESSDAEFAAERLGKRRQIVEDFERTNTRRQALLQQIHDLIIQLPPLGNMQLIENKARELGINENTIMRAPLEILATMRDFIREQLDLYQRELVGEGKKKRRSLKKK